MSYSIKGVPWKYKGAVNVENCKTSADVISAAGLNWTVSKCELVAKMPIHTDKPKDNGFVFGFNNYVECPNAYATYRTDYNIPLGIVKERYTPVQNNEAFTFFDDAIGKDKAIWQTAGFFGLGERIFVSAKLPKTILVNGDPVQNYLVFTTSHDGSSGVKILFTLIRVVCENTLNAAIRNSDNYVSFRHTNSVHSNINIAKEILGICDNKISFIEEAYNFMAKIKASDNFAQQTFANIVFTKDEQQNIIRTGHTIKQIITRDWKAIEDSKISMQKVNTILKMNDYYFNGVGQKNIIGTNWGVYNAITGYYSNVDNSNGTKRMDTLLYGDKSRKLKLAGNLLYC